MPLPLLPINERYWDGAAFEKATRAKWPDTSWRTRARHLQLEVSRYHKLCKGSLFPNLETYCRLIALAEAEPGDWLRRER